MLEKILGKDPDIVFAYQTERILQVKDWTLAIIGNIFTFGVLLYMILYVFMILQTYNIKGVWTGYAFFSVQGKGYSQTNSTLQIWDHGDLLYPEQDSKGLMLGFRVDEIKEQTYGYCTYPCYTDSDCPDDPPRSYPVCAGNGYCESPTWCPNIDANDTEFESYYVKGVENFKVSIWSGITFPQFDSEEYISYGKGDSVYPDNKANVFYVKEILMKSEIQSIEEISETGAIIYMNFDWHCNTILSSCTPDITFSRSDSKSLPTYYRLLIRSYGEGYKFSLFLTVLQISAALALLKMANLLSDWVILYAYPIKSKREEFAKLKTEESVDFSDKAYKIDYINFMRKQDEEDGEIGN